MILWICIHGMALQIMNNLLIMFMWHTWQHTCNGVLLFCYVNARIGTRISERRQRQPEWLYHKN